jgi:hypothetical protein
MISFIFIIGAAEPLRLRQGQGASTGYAPQVCTEQLQS